jgi:hypothetical protein
VGRDKVEEEVCAWEYYLNHRILYVPPQFFVVEAPQLYIAA